MSKRVTLLDGGASTQLQKYVDEQVDGDPLWTAKFLARSPEKCILAHRDFVLAGAKIISTVSYQATVQGFQTYLNMSREESLKTIKNSVNLARQGIQLAQSQTEENEEKCYVQVAGSVGPYGAYLHDGSEYTGSYTDKVTTEELIAWHRPKVEALIEAGVDILAFETLPCYKEAEALIKLLKEFPQAKAWISFSIKNSTSISNGESFYENVLKCWENSDQLVAVGANCFHPSLVIPLFKGLREAHPELPLITYPNKGGTYDTSKALWLDEDGVGAATYVSEWIDLGLAYLGGCCRTDDTVIRAMSEEIQKCEQSQS